MLPGHACSAAWLPCQTKLRGLGGLPCITLDSPARLHLHPANSCCLLPAACCLQIKELHSKLVKQGEMRPSLVDCIRDMALAHAW
jgi:hypothetical protein